jgi:bla regulator protein BlaR1
MTPISVMQASTSLLAQAASPAVRALVLGSAAALGLAAFRVKNTSVRLFAWTAVLYGALAMPLLGWLLPTLSIPAPAFLQSVLLHQDSNHAAARFVRTKGEVSIAHDKVAKDTASAEIVRQTSVSVPSPSSSKTSSIPWSVVAAGIYLAVLLLLLVRFCIGIVFTRRLMRAAKLVDDSHITQRLGSHALALGLKSVTRALESEAIFVPVTLGVLRSAILLPADWHEWEEAKIDAVIAHEMSHVARRDALTQSLSLVHRAIFWFSPFAWWLDRHLANLAEQASDDAALSCGVDNKDYVKTLLGFFEALQAAPGRVWWQGVAMAKAGQAEQRVERILSWRGAVAMSLKKSVAVAVIALAVPVVYLAASARAVNPNLAAQAEAGVAVAQPIITSKPAPVPAIAQAAEAAAATEPVAKTEAVMAQAEAENVAASSEHGVSYAYGYDDEQRFVIVTGKSDSLTMSGSTQDAKHVEKLRKTIPGDFIWFQRDEKSYIIRDQATIDRARKLWAPQEELGRKQEELGKQQEALGKQQEEIGARMEQIQVNVPDMTAELDKLKAELKQLNSSATMDQVGQIQSEIGDLQSKIGELQSQAGEKQSKLGGQQGALGEKQGKLGEQQGELGRQQEEMAKEATRQMKKLLDEAIAKGTAQLEL